MYRALLSKRDILNLPEPVTVDCDNGYYAQCTSFIRTDTHGNVPILDISMMSEEAERALAARQKKLHPELYAELVKTG